MANLLFSTEDAVDRVLTNITSRLCNNGLLLMTITDANVLVHRVRELGKRTSDGKWIYGNEHYSIMFDSLEFKGSPYGLKYNFFLEDSVGERNEDTGEIIYVPEYLIEMKEFMRKTESYGFEVLENLNFTEVYHKYKENPKYFELMQKM